MNNIPNWYALLLLALAAWRTYRMLAEDTILNWPRRKLLRLDPDWEEGPNKTNPPNPEYRFELGEFLTCKYCAGFWISLAWWGAWLAWPHATLVVTVPLAINTVLIGVAKLDEK